MKSRDLFLIGCAVLFLGSDDNGALTIDDLPACPDHTHLRYHGGRIVCSPILPNCSGQLLTTQMAMGPAQLACTPKYPDSLSENDRQRLSALQNEMTSLASEFAALSMDPTGPAKFIGNTVATTDGRIEFAGIAAGLPAANARCAAEFGAGAHMCSPGEMLGAVYDGTLDPATDVPKAWLYMPTWNNPGVGAVEPLAGLGDNCGGYTDGSDDFGWTGTAVEWSPQVYDIRVLHFDSGTRAPCTSVLPIACCR